MEFEPWPVSRHPLKCVEQPRNSLGRAVLADIEQSRLWCHRRGEEQIVSVAGADLVNAVAADRQAPLELVGVATVKDRKGVNVRAAFTHLIREMRAELHLADAGGVALGQDGDVRRDVFEFG